MIDVYCALCGVPVELEYSLYHGRVDEEDVAWTFRLHRLETSTGSFTCHLFCWRNLRQQYDAFFNASQAFHVDLVTNILSNLGESQTTNRLSPNWCNGYEEPLSHIGPANAAMADGWMDFDGADPEHLDFLAVDPARLPDKVLKTLLDASTDTASLAPEDDFIADGRNAGLSKQNADALPPRTVGLERLPIELLKDIFQLLPLESARALRCVSRYFSNITLDGGFWRSRLIYPHELHHFGSTRLGPGPPKGKDLEKVYRALIQPSEPSRHWLNWNRIASNNTRLLQRIQEEHRNPGMDRASTPAQIRDGTSEIQNFEVPGYTAVRRFALRFDEKHPVAAVRKIRLSFVRTEHRYLVSGICFFFENDRLCLGYERGDKYENFEISRPDVFGGFDAELDSYGFYGLHPLKVLQIGGQFSGSKGRAYFDFDPQWLHARFAICPTQDIIGFDVATSVVSTASL